MHFQNCSFKEDSFKIAPSKNTSQFFFKLSKKLFSIALSKNRFLKLLPAKKLVNLLQLFKNYHSSNIYHSSQSVSNLSIYKNLSYWTPGGDQKGIMNFGLSILLSLCPSVLPSIFVEFFLQLDHQFFLKLSVVNVHGVLRGSWI